MSRVRTGGRAEALAHLHKGVEFLDAAFDRLLGQKDKAQYDRRDVSETEAKAALRRAQTMLKAAETALAGP